jgi:cellulose synthase/poly-beta-1,6-N-acetylglucosamine synthase-like glycosyltransferase
MGPRGFFSCLTTPGPPTSDVAGLMALTTSVAISPQTGGTSVCNLEPLLSPRQRVLHTAAAAAWALAILYFWVWWLQPKHNIGTAWFALNSMALAWLTLVPLYLLSLYIRGRVSAAQVAPPAGRVAMVVTKAPSEPWSVVRETLEAMLAQDYPHDTWLADEVPTHETLAWCKEHGVQISTRNGIADYHCTSWPRRTRCKEGNLAYFYDHYGYDLYDFVVQMDADHVPSRGYLREMLKPFADETVGYVSAPSICDKNAAKSWSARGRLYVEATVHGLLQAAYSNGWAPLCIGSHYAVRTRALREIGGLGPELAEDHSTTLMMNAYGWRGVHALNAIAHGDGASTFRDLIIQEFQWSRSLMTILLQHTGTYISRLPLALKVQFVFCQLWYSLFSFFMFLIFAMPIIALATGRPFANVTLTDFFMHSLPAEIIIILLAWRWKSNGWFRPADAKLFSWEAVLFLHARWPWTLAGSLVAVCDHFSRSFVDFRVTPKGKAVSPELPLWAIAPYGVLALISGLSAIAFSDAQSASGFYFFAILNCALYAALLAITLVRHAMENDLSWSPRPLPALARYATCASLMVLVIAGGAIRGPAALEGVTWGAGPVSFTTTTYSASGAGQRGDRIRHIRFTLFERG